MSIPPRKDPKKEVLSDSKSSQTSSQVDKPKVFYCKWCKKIDPSHPRGNCPEYPREKMNQAQSGKNPGHIVTEKLSTGFESVEVKATLDSAAFVSVIDENFSQYGRRLGRGDLDGNTISLIPWNRVVL
eukprot:TRINITY_DN9953_c0_g3_i1.p1 TRINITY_DN9953_c0_g3~~TRINITY_DN9953_c0_g3_i1.p1  ORF type:complete len:128 (-),score=35.79 TRINITY_DN9953_c0_g3_i1:33-416(-)